MRDQRRSRGRLERATLKEDPTIELADVDVQLDLLSALEGHFEEVEVLAIRSTHETLAALHIASVAAMVAIRPLVSMRPSASLLPLSWRELVVTGMRNTSPLKDH